MESDGKNHHDRREFERMYEQYASGISTNTYMLDMLDGPEYAYWYNLAREMDGDSPIFSSEHVAKMLSGEGGWGNTNWYKETFGVGQNMNFNINATGGNEKMKYFVSLGNYRQNVLFILPMQPILCMALLLLAYGVLSECLYQRLQVGADTMY